MKHKHTSNTSVVVTEKPRSLSCTVTSPSGSTFFSPWKAVVCGIDTAKVSGFSVWESGNYVVSMSVSRTYLRYECVQTGKENGM